ncbi:MAG: hypothetical protein HKN08_09290 [Gammaproteobacteria bacterium]|nr:hypothetical protein [Gammaproteobacteria bacterium]
METCEHQEQLITDIDAREFFHGALEDALQNQAIAVSGETVVYLGNLLTTFIKSDYLFEHTEDGMMLKPLAMHYQDAVEAKTLKQRFILLRRLGDVSLFISGMYSQSLNRGLVDIDYYIAMGGNAYSYLSETGKTNITDGLKVAFFELASRFTDMINVLSEVSEASNLSSNFDVLRMYELWQKTGSSRIADKLKQTGIQPVKTAMQRH